MTNTMDAGRRILKVSLTGDASCDKWFIEQAERVRPTLGYEKLPPVLEKMLWLFQNVGP